MKITKEKTFVAIVGFFLLSYLLEAIVKPISIQLSSPYAFLSPLYFTKFPFTSVVVIIRSISLFLTPLLILSFFSKKYLTKAGLLLIIAILSQLLSFQEIISDTTLIPLEWALSLSLAGATLVIPIFMYFLKGIFVSAKTKLTQTNSPDEHIEYEE